LGAAIVLGVQLALIEPWIVNRIALRAAGYAVPGAAVELLVIMLIFTLALLAMLVALARVTYALRLPAAWPALPLPWFQNQGADRPLSGPRVSGAAGVAPGAERSRAAAIADAVAATQRREGPAAAAFTAPRYSSPDGSHSRTSATPVAGRTVSGQDMRAPPPPLGQSYRRVRNRTSLGAARRDRTS
jgi:type IV secretion system protein VirB6